MPTIGTERPSSRWRLILCLFVSQSIAFGCLGPIREAPQTERVVVSSGWIAMGTLFEADLRVPRDSEEAARRWLEEARVSLARLEGIYSRHDPESELSKLNDALAGEVGVTIQISDALAAALDLARLFHAETEGLFDPTIGPLIELWWRAAENDRRPDAAAIRAAKARTGFDGLERIGNRSVRIRRSGTRIDLDGISKGIAIDHLREDFVRRFPTSAALLSFGQSSVFGIGTPLLDGRFWNIAVRSRLEGSEEWWSEFSFRDKAISVSSSGGSTIEIGGRSYSHLIDPKSGEPIPIRAEVAVIGRSAARVDAFSTALLIAEGMGVERSSLQSLLGREGESEVEFKASFWPPLEPAAPERAVD